MSLQIRTLFLLCCASVVGFSPFAFPTHSPRAAAPPLTRIFLPVIIVAQRSELPVSVTVVQSIDSCGGPYGSVEGIVRNDSKVNVTDVKLEICAYWSDEQLCADTTAYLRILRPGETSPFSAAWRGCSFIRYTIGVTAVPTDEEPYNGETRVINETSTLVDSGRYDWGEVVNNGARSINSAIYTAYFDASGKILPFSVQGGGGYLAPGMRAPFGFRAGPEAASYQRWIHAEPLPDGENAINLSITVNSLLLGNNGDLLAAGEVSNPSSVTVDSYTSYAIFRNAQDGVIGLSSKLHLFVELLPGQTQPFEHAIASSSIPAQYAKVDFYALTSGTAQNSGGEPGGCSRLTASGGSGMWR